MKQQKWTKDEIEFLISNYNKLSLDELAQKLDRTLSSIVHAATRFGLKNKKLICKHGHKNVWSKDDIDFLVSNYKSATNVYLCDYLDKSIKSLVSMMKELDLKEEDRHVSKTFFHPDSVEFIKNNYKIYNDEELTKIINDRFEPANHKKSVKSVFKLRTQVLNIRREKSIIRKPPKDAWSEQDEQYLVDNCYNLSIDELARNLKRTPKAVQCRMSKLGLNKITNRGTKFTQEKNEYLRENFDKLPINEICQNLQIPIFRVIAQAQYLGLITEVHYLTDIEIFIKDTLKSLNIPFKEQYKIVTGKRSWVRVDFLIGKNIVLEVQGDYYHCNPKIFPNGPEDHIQAESIQRDQSKFDKLTKMNYDVKYIWENDIKTTPNKVITFLKQLKI